MSVHVVKVQRPLDDATAPWLVYAQGREKLCVVAVPGEVSASVGDALRAFFRAVWDDDTGWTFLDRVADEPW